MVPQPAALRVPFGTIRPSQRGIGLVANGVRTDLRPNTKNVENDPSRT